MKNSVLLTEKIDKLTRGNFVGGIRQLKQLAAKMEGEELVHAYIGEPGFPIPEISKEAIKKAVDDGKGNQYPPFLGTDRLRDQICYFFNKKTGIELKRKNIIITSGGMHGNKIIFSAYSKTGLPKKGFHISPFFPMAEMQIWGSGLKSDHLNMGEYKGGNLHREMKKRVKNGNYGFMHANFPNNPTGKVASKEDFKKWGEFCNKKDMFFFFDAAYFGMVYGGKEDYNTTLPYCKKCLVSGWATKGESMAGLRLGWIVVPDEVYDLEFPNFAEFQPPKMRGQLPITFGSQLEMESFTSIASANYPAMVALADLLENVNGGDESYFQELRNFYGGKLDTVRGIINDSPIVEEMDYGTMGEPSAALYTTMGPKKGLNIKDSNKFSRILADHRIFAPGMDNFAEYGKVGARISVSMMDERAMYLFANGLKQISQKYV